MAVRKVTPMTSFMPLTVSVGNASGQYASAYAPFPQLSAWPVSRQRQLMGIGGFIGLLVAVHYIPNKADLLRVFALLWFFGFGVIYVAVSWRKRDPGGRRRRPRRRN